jgi:hypothetical protein
MSVLHHHPSSRRRALAAPASGLLRSGLLFAGPMRAGLVLAGLLLAALSASGPAEAAPGPDSAATTSGIGSAAGAGSAPAASGTGSTAAGAGMGAGGSSIASLIPGLFAVNVNSHKCLTVGAGAAVVQRTCAESPAYRWRLVPASLDGLFLVQNLGTGRCLTIAGGGAGDNGAAVAYRCDDALSRRWRMRAADGPGIHVVNANSGKCLTIAGGGVGENGESVQYPCDREASRRWSFRLTMTGGNAVTIAGDR